MGGDDDDDDVNKFANTRQILYFDAANEQTKSRILTSFAWNHFINL